MTFQPWLARLGTIASLAGACGCQAELEQGLDEAQANAIVVALDQHGIGATKSAELGGGEEPAYTVSVAPDDVAPALAVLRSEGLPRERDPGLDEMFGEGSLVPTATEERARMTAALSGELSRSIESIDGVLDARVHVSMVSAEDRPLDGHEAPRPTASVLLRYTGSRPPVDESAIRRIVAGSIVTMRADDVTVVTVGRPPPVAGEARLDYVGPIAVARGSAPTLR
ncbi:MAG: secretion protein, partial [Deltaproteobacteria bacterium]